MKMFVLAVVLTLCLSDLAHAQNQQWIVYSSRRDMVNASVEEGEFLWLGSNRGLIRLEKSSGVATYYNTSNSGLPENDITELVIDQEGKKWMSAGFSGLISYDGAVWTTYNTSN